MATNLQENATHLNNVEGIIQRGNSNGFPTNSGPAGLSNGEMYVNTSTNVFFIRYNNAWWGRAMS